MSYAMPALLSLLTTVVLLPLLMRAAPRLGLLDAPAARKVHAYPVPRVGGIAIACGALVGIVAGGAEGVPSWPFFAATLVILVFGVIDDHRDIDFRIKFMGQVLAAGLVISDGVAIHSISLTTQVELPAGVSLVLTGVFLVGITNAINLSDGLDGLAAGTTFLSLAAIAILATSAEQWTPVLVAVCLSGAVLGFLRFNTHPARVFMGDAGSQLLGFTVGVLSLLATQASSTAVSASVPVLLLGLPILDTLSVMVTRMRAGRSPFSADRNHLHHRLLALGLDHHEAVVLLYGVQGVLFVLAYQLRFDSDLVILAVYVGFCTAVLVLLDRARQRQWRIRAPRVAEAAAAGPAGGGFLTRLIDHWRKPERLPRYLSFAVAALMGVYAGFVIAHGAAAGRDVVLGAGLLCVGLGARALMRRTLALTVVDKALLYLLAALLVYVSAALSARQHVPAYVEWGLPLAIAVATAIRLRLLADRTFALTSLDLLVLFAAFVVPNLPGIRGLPQGAGLTIAKLVVLFYAIELVATRGTAGVRWIRAGAALLAGALAGTAYLT